MPAMDRISFAGLWPRSPEISWRLRRVCVRTPTEVGFKLNFEDREKNATRYTDK